MKTKIRNYFDNLIRVAILTPVVFLAGIFLAFLVSFTPNIGSFLAVFFAIATGIVCGTALAVALCTGKNIYKKL